MFGFGGYGDVGDAAGQQRNASQYAANQGWASQYAARRRQSAAESPLLAYAHGTAPTAADYTAQAQRDANMAAAQSMAAGARGGNVGLAQYQAANAGAAANQAAAQQATQANLAAQQGWWNQYLSLLAQERGQDLQGVGTQLGAASSAQNSLASMYGAQQQAQSQLVGGLAQGIGTVGAAGIRASGS